MLRSSATALAIVAILAAIPTAHAKDAKPVEGENCPSSLKAKITEGAIAKISVLAPSPKEALADPVATYERDDTIAEPKSGKHFYVEAYVTTEDTTLDAQGNTVTLQRMTLFYLGCYGQHKGGPLFPMISVRPQYRKVVEATIKTDKERPAAFKTATLLGGPNGLVEQTIHLTDTRMRSTVSSTETLSITPQIGRKAGKCFYPHSGRVWITGRTQVLKK